MSYFPKAYSNIFNKILYYQMYYNLYVLKKPIKIYEYHYFLDACAFFI